MVKVRSWAGLDVHARSVLAVTMDAETGELRSGRLPGETAKVVDFFLCWVAGSDAGGVRGWADGVPLATPDLRQHWLSRRNPVLRQLNRV